MSIIYNVDVKEADIGFREKIMTSGLKGAKLRFSFDDIWADYSKTAVLKAGDVTEEINLDQTTLVTMPMSLFSEFGQELLLGVVGEYEDIKVLPTIWKSLGIIREGTEKIW